MANIKSYTEINNIIQSNDYSSLIGKDVILIHPDRYYKEDDCCYLVICDENYYWIYIGDLNF